MADFPAPARPEGTAPQTPVTAVLATYALFAAGAVATLVSSGFPVALPLWGLLGIVGVIVAYVKREDARDTWLASHLRWLIRTFWFSLVWGIVGGIVFVTFIGIPVAILIWAVGSIWVLYRVIKGYLLFKDNRPIPGM